MPAYSGLIAITSVSWLSPRSLSVRWQSGHPSTGPGARCHHVYGGRTRIGIASPGQRVLSVQLLPATWPEHLTVVAVDPDQRGDDFGDALPIRPYNRVRLRFTAAGFPSDAEFLDVTAGTAPGGAVDPNNRIARLFFAAAVTQYEALTEPLAGSGTWNFTITPRDNRPSGGNAGTAENVSQAVLAHPPDVARESDGDRLSVAVSGGVATVTATLPA